MGNSMFVILKLLLLRIFRLSYCTAESVLVLGNGVLLEAGVYFSCRVWSAVVVIANAGRYFDGGLQKGVIASG